MGKKENITFVNTSAREFLNSLDDDEKIWLVGGADIIKEFLKNNLIEDFIITVIPTVLGEGIPLFEEGCGEHQLELQNIKKYDTGVVQLFYSS